MKLNNIFESIPDTLENELFETLAQSNNVKIERIVSKGHTSPESGWYNQEQNEWLIVIKGEAIILFEDDQEVNLTAGSYLNIPAYRKHKVSWTSTNEETIWLAIHY